MNRVRIIAEVGSNYDGNIERAMEYIKAVKASGADMVKFQTLQKEKLVAPKIWTKGSCDENPVYKNFSNLELPDEWHFILKQAADEQGLEFISTPFYMEAVDILEKVGVRTYKIASGDITFRPLLTAVGQTRKRIILSTGGSSLYDVEQALNILRQSGAGEIVLLHCVSNYPPQWNEMNLRCIVTLKRDIWSSGWHFRPYAGIYCSPCCCCPRGHGSGKACHIRPITSGTRPSLCHDGG